MQISSRRRLSQISRPREAVVDIRAILKENPYQVTACGMRFRMTFGATGDKMARLMQKVSCRVFCKWLPACAVVALGIVATQPVGRGETTGMFAPTELRTVSGKHLDPENFLDAETCGACHSAHFEQWDGSVHSRAHEDSIYLAFAKLARKEGGDKLYLFCSACHAPAGVAVGEIPSADDSNHSFLTKEGVTCDACHSAADVRAVHEGAPANASLVLSDSGTRYGPIEGPAEADAHDSAYAEIFKRAEFCSACHTLTHPYNGLLIENTYAEWKAGPYAEAGIQCQDCHMRTVEQAVNVAQSMQPLKVPGVAADDGPERDNIHNHMFVGANVNGDAVGAGAEHVAAARQRLKSAATLALKLPQRVMAGGELAVEVSVSNVAAGHAIPTSITELREVWIDLTVIDADGGELFRSGAVDAKGRVDPDAVMYHSVLVDKDGEVTYLPWRAEKTVKEKLIPPRTTVHERYAVPIPAGAKAPLRVAAVLRYRSASQYVLDELFGEGRFSIEIVDMAAANSRIEHLDPP